MSFHDDLTKWLERSEAGNCPVCRSLPMPEGMVDIVELPSSWLSAEPVDCLSGACHLTAKRHVLELYELDDSELLGLMRDVQVCARALKSVTGAVKINYEIHGNTLPHLHVHLYPRHVDDPFAGRPIDFGRKERLYSDEEFAEFVDRMRAVIAECTRAA